MKLLRGVVVSVLTIALLSVLFVVISQHRSVPHLLGERVSRHANNKPATVKSTARASQDAGSFSLPSSAAAQEWKDKVLILTPLRDASHFIGRHFTNLRGFTYPHELISLGFLESDSCQDQVHKTKELVAAQFARSDFADLFYEKAETNYHVEHKDRHHYELQLTRRAALAHGRNTLLAKTLANRPDFEWVLWVDVDMSYLPDNLLETLIGTGKDIVQPNCVFTPGGFSYDINAFQETRPDGWWDASDEEAIFEGYAVDHQRLHLDDLRAAQQPLVQLHGVGAAVLLVRAAVHRAGVLFPETLYKKHIETEGFAKMAIDRGYTLWGLPHYEVFHEYGTHLRRSEWNTLMHDNVFPIAIQGNKRADVRLQALTPFADVVISVYAPDLTPKYYSLSSSAAGAQERVLSLGGHFNSQIVLFVKENIDQARLREFVLAQWLVDRKASAASLPSLSSLNGSALANFSSLINESFWLLSASNMSTADSPLPRFFFNESLLLNFTSAANLTLFAGANFTSGFNLSSSAGAFGTYRLRVDVTDSALCGDGIVDPSEECDLGNKSFQVWSKQCCDRTTCKKIKNCTPRVTKPRRS